MGLINFVFIKTMTKPYTKPQSYFVLIILLSISRVHPISADGFTIDLIPRDFMQSPSLTSYERVRNSLQRSFSRARFFAGDVNRSPQSAAAASADVVPDGGEYLVKFSLGTPPVQTLAIADTGSDLTWIQCEPCYRCYKQIPPLFDPRRSSTYKPVACTSRICKSVVHQTICNDTTHTCGYRMSYGDGSLSLGDVATEKMSLGGSSRPNFIIGCGHADLGLFSNGSAGIIGLGRGKESLITQLGSSIHGKFSYCLTPKHLNGSKMYFGDNAVVSGGGVVSTPLTPKTRNSFYHLTLEGITVNNQRFDLVSTDGSGPSSEEGNIIIDSGTPLTFLPPDLYKKVKEAVERQVKLPKVEDPERILKLCYHAAMGDEGEKLPGMVVHFRGADVRLSSANTFVRTSNSTLCLAFTPPMEENVHIYGNIAQLNFLVGYDLEKMTVSFKPTGCGSKGGEGII